MEIELIVIGKTNAEYVKAGIEEYCNRLKRYIAYNITVLNDVKNAGRLSEDEQKEAEARMVLQRLQTSDYVVLLDERGKMPTSVEFAAYLQKIMASGKKKLVFVVGGPYGFAQSLYDRAKDLLSLSRLTFNHEMVRLFFTEQVYRAMTILRGEPYHHQ